MKNNLAELRSIDINLDVLQAEWVKLVTYQSEYKWGGTGGRNFVEFSFFTLYFQQLLLDIENVLGEKPKNYIIQMHDPALVVNDKWYLNIPHQDYDRKTCINIPVYYNRIEPVNFFSMDVIKEYEKKNSKIGTRRYVGMSPEQVGQYSDQHPTLMNVNNYHNVRVIDESQPRIFIQMSYKTPYKKFLKHVDHLHLL